MHSSKTVPSVPVRVTKASLATVAAAGLAALLLSGSGCGEGPGETRAVNGTA